VRVVRTAPMIPLRPVRLLLFLLVALALGASNRAGAAASTPPVLLVLGDSISAGYGLASGAGWVNLLGERLHKDGYPYEVVNASISGDTTAGGRSRLPALLAQHRPRIVIVELGGNDALRGGNLEATRVNLDSIVSTVQAAGAQPVIVGMQLPPNYGSTYVKAFGALFGDVGKARKVPVVPFVFEGFADDLAQFQPDRIHPVAAAQPRILANVWPTLAPLLSRSAR